MGFFVDISINNFLTNLLFNFKQRGIINVVAHKIINFMEGKE